MRPFTLLLFCFLTVPWPALSQAGADSLLTYELDEVLVTATRGTGESLRLPMAVGVVSATEFFATRRIGLNDALVGMPGVLVQSRAGGQDVRLTIRGFGARGQGDRSNAATVRGIKVLVDGIPETEPDGRTALDLVDLASAHRIEVVRTNASTLFGNASGGVVNIETLPWFVDPYGETEHSYGNYGFRRNSISVGAPLGSGRFSLSASTLSFSGWRENSSSAATRFSASFVSDITLRARLKVMAAATDNLFHIPGPLTQVEFDTDPQRANPRYASNRERRYNRIGRFAVKLTNTLDRNHTFEFLGYAAPKLLERSERGTFRNFNRLHLGGGLIYRWKGEGVPLSPLVTAGFDAATQDGTILFYSLVDGRRGDSLRTNKREAASTLGAFVQGELQLVGPLSLTLGARVDRQVYVTEEFAAGVRRSTPQEKLVLDHFTPRLALLYRISSGHSAYVSVSGGVEAPAFNEVDPPPTLTGVTLNPLLKPMSSTTVEVGLKGLQVFQQSLLLQSVSYSVAAYRIEIRNEIVPYNGGAWFFSAGKSRRTGLEFGGQGAFGAGFSLASAVTLLSTEYLEYRNELGNFSGNDVAGIPSVVFSSRLRYSPGDGFGAELAVEHVGSFAADDANRIRVPPSTILNGAVNYATSFDGVRLRVYAGGNNLAGRKYAASAFINPTTRRASGEPVLPEYLEPGLPRNFYGGMDFRLEL